MTDIGLEFIASMEQTANIALIDTVLSVDPRADLKPQFEHGFEINIDLENPK